ncbi:MAG: VCBS repeat-containing protein [Flavobacteriales bacterium]|nr:VCBS repeat-containing protein [Flavobacteriales bacterium]
MQHRLNAQQFQWDYSSDLLTSERLYNEHFADIDGDGDLDALTFLFSGIRTGVNDGSGHFSSVDQFNPPGLTNAYSGAFADADNDGDADVLMGLSNRIVWYRNDGTGTFGAMDTIALDYGTHRRIIGKDFNADGLLDVLYSAQPNTSSSFLHVVFGTGGGEFSEPYSLSDDLGYYLGIDVADFDGNGFQDILVSAKPDGLFPSAPVRVIGLASPFFPLHGTTIEHRGLGRHG